MYDVDSPSRLEVRKADTTKDVILPWHAFPAPWIFDAMWLLPFFSGPRFVSEERVQVVVEQYPRFDPVWSFEGVSIRTDFNISERS